MGGEGIHKNASSNKKKRGGLPMISSINAYRKLSIGLERRVKWSLTTCNGLLLRSRC